MDVYGRWGTIARNGGVTFANNDFRITTTNFPPVFAGTDPANKADGHYDPVYPPGGVNLHWWYANDWPAPPGNFAADSYKNHVGEYNGAVADRQYVYLTWTDYRLLAEGTRYARNQSDIRFVKIPWPQ